MTGQKKAAKQIAKFAKRAAQRPGKLMADSPADPPTLLDLSAGSVHTLQILQGEMGARPAAALNEATIIANKIWSKK